MIERYRHESGPQSTGPFGPTGEVGEAAHPAIECEASSWRWNSCPVGELVLKLGRREMKPRVESLLLTTHYSLLTTYGR